MGFQLVDIDELVEDIKIEMKKDSVPWLLEK
jgi:hypothetical protein